MAIQDATQPVKRKRRPPGEGRVLVLAAAKEAFSELGYAGATTRDIAERAGVVEPLLFRSFGSKAALFNEVVFGPIRAFVLDWGQTPADDSLPPGAAEREFVTRLYDLLHENRGLVVSYLAASAFEPEVLETEGAKSALVELLNTLDSLADERRFHSGDTTADGKSRRRRSRQRVSGIGSARLTERIQVGTVMAAALFGDELFAALDKRPTREAIIDELVRILTAAEKR